MAVRALRKVPWLIYFKDDYRWSFNVHIALAMGRSGGGDIGEVDQVCRVLQKKSGDEAAWFREWKRMGDRLRLRGEEDLKKGRRLSAANSFQRACTYYQMGERFRLPKDKAALGAYKESIRCFRRYAALTDRPSITPVEIPFGRKRLPGYLIPPQGKAKAKPPVVVLYNGFDGTKEMSVNWAADTLTRRGMAVAAVDSPGVGEAIRFRRIHLRYDVEVAGTAVLDWLERRRDVNARRAAIMAPSLGGYYAPRTASMEPRFKACVAWGAIWDYHAIWKKRIEAAFRMQLPVPGDHLCWSLKTKTLEQALKKLEKFKLDGVVQRMRCPFLLVHGVDDQQIPISDARACHRAVGSEDKTLKVFRGPDGGAQHCNTDYLAPVVDYMADWLKEKLRA